MTDLASDDFPLRIFIVSIMESNPRQHQCFSRLLAERGGLGHVTGGGGGGFAKSGLLPKHKSFTFHKHTVGAIIRI